jgi:ribosomal 50S subunit-associated protein YjgA (DUF615 family)
MKKKDEEDDDLLPEYRFDYSKSQPNRFAKKYNQTQRTVVLDSDVTEGFPDAESVNEALRSLLRNTEKEEKELQTK